MGIKNMMMDTESKQGKWFYTKMLTWLDSPNREKYDDARALVKSSGIQAGQRVLEIGCGSGYFTVHASKMLGQTGRLYATDINAIAVEETNRKIIHLGLDNVTVKQDDAMQSSFGDEEFDVVLLYGVVPAPVISMEDISREIYRMLKLGGIYAIWTKVPFWSPKSITQKLAFRYLEKDRGVFRLCKQ